MAVSLSRNIVNETNDARTISGSSRTVQYRFCDRTVEIGSLQELFIRKVSADTPTFILNQEQEQSTN